MLSADVNADSITLAGAFLLGAILATIAVLRVVRSVTNFFSGHHQRPPRRPPDDEDDGEQ